MLPIPPIHFYFVGMPISSNLWFDFLFALEALLKQKNYKWPSEYFVKIVTFTKISLLIKVNLVFYSRGVIVTQVEFFDPKI